MRSNVDDFDYEGARQAEQEAAVENDFGFDATEPRSDDDCMPAVGVDGNGNDEDVLVALIGADSWDTVCVAKLPPARAGSKPFKVEIVNNCYDLAFCVTFHKQQQQPRARTERRAK